MKNKPIHLKGMIALLGILIIIPLFYIILINMGYIENNVFRFLKKSQKIEQISCGFQHIAALTSSGQAVCAGSIHTVGLRKDGTVVATGRIGGLEVKVDGWTDIVAIAAGGSCTVGLKSDGTAVSTGSSFYGDQDVSDWTDITAITAGGNIVAGLKKDGTIAIAPRAPTECKIIAAGNCWLSALRADGTVLTTNTGMLDSDEYGVVRGGWAVEFSESIPTQS